jgi:hypothetical protein
MTSNTAQVHESVPGVVIEYMRIGDLVLTQNSQRPIREGTVARLKRDFDWLLFDPPGVARLQKDDQFYVITGQHHYSAARELFGEDQIIPVRDMGVLTVAESVRLGMKHNTSAVKPTMIERWQGLVREGDPLAIAAEKALSQHGLIVSGGGGVNSISAAGQLHSIIRMYNNPEDVTVLLDRIFTAITTAWPEDRAGHEGRFNGAILKAIRFVMEDNENLDPVTFAMEGLRTTPFRLIDEGSAGRSPFIVIGELMLQSYNRGKRINAATKNRQKISWRYTE